MGEKGTTLATACPHVGEPSLPLSLLFSLISSLRGSGSAQHFTVRAKTWPGQSILSQ
jgi:hypothetical protein